MVFDNINNFKNPQDEIADKLNEDSAYIIPNKNDNDQNTDQIFDIKNFMIDFRYTAAIEKLNHWFKYK